MLTNVFDQLTMWYSIRSVLSLNTIDLTLPPTPDKLIKLLHVAGRQCASEHKLEADIFVIKLGIAL